MSDAVLFDGRDDGIAVITLNRPETRNCLADVRAGLAAGLGPVRARSGPAHRDSHRRR
ncbi:hypothetical protein [Nocardia sp. NPDC049526]|uniref:hypothetical protein n=1 Tax=Nocardia sp. NPDC049526 TaxID=3364316 RepID=UPI0037A0BA30